MNDNKHLQCSAEPVSRGSGVTIGPADLALQGGAVFGGCQNSTLAMVDGKNHRKNKKCRLNHSRQTDGQKKVSKKKGSLRELRREYRMDHRGRNISASRGRQWSALRHWVEDMNNHPYSCQKMPNSNILLKED